MITSFLFRSIIYCSFRELFDMGRVPDWDWVAAASWYDTEFHFNYTMGTAGGLGSLFLWLYVPALILTPLWLVSLPCRLAPESYFPMRPMSVLMALVFLAYAELVLIFGFWTPGMLDILAMLLVGTGFVYYFWDNLSSL